MSAIEQPASRLVAGGQDVGALGHEVDAAEQDELGVALGGGQLGQLVAVAPEVGELDDLITLVVVSEDDQPVAELGAQRADPGIADRGVHAKIIAGDAFLAERLGAVGPQCLIGASPLFRDTGRRVELGVHEPRSQDHRSHSSPGDTIRRRVARAGLCAADRPEPRDAEPGGRVVADERPGKREILLDLRGCRLPFLLVMIQC
jgi:hypothetical protein